MGVWLGPKYATSMHINLLPELGLHTQVLLVIEQAQQIFQEVLVTLGRNEITVLLLLSEAIILTGRKFNDFRKISPEQKS